MSVMSVSCPYCKSKDSFIYSSKQKEYFLCFDCQRHLPSHKVDFGEIKMTRSLISFNSLLNLCTKVADLPEDHLCVKYLESRLIPKEKLSRLYYTERFADIAKTIEKETKNGPRLVIPFFDKKGNMFAMQGRALDDDKVRYITLVFDKQEELFYGADTVNFEKDFTVVEGPIDSLFLENSVATAGVGNISDKYKSSAIICFDNEPRNKDIVRLIKKNIDRGFKTVIWPDTIKQKDINDMVKYGIDVKSVIEQNTFQGIGALVRLNSWKKV